MRLNRKVTFVLCTVPGRYVPDGFDSWEDVKGKGIYIYVYEEHTEITRMKGTCRKGGFF